MTYLFTFVSKKHLIKKLQYYIIKYITIISYFIKKFYKLK